MLRLGHPQMGTLGVVDAIAPLLPGHARGEPDRERIIVSFGASKSRLR
jgi:hypothetical protein